MYVANKRTLIYILVAGIISIFWKNVSVLTFDSRKWLDVYAYLCLALSCFYTYFLFVCHRCWCKTDYSRIFYSVLDTKLYF